MKTHWTLKTVIGFLAVNFYINGMNNASARWATQNDAQQIVNYDTSNIYLYKDGTSIRTKEIECIILKDLAKKSWSNYTIEYNSKINAYKILEARTKTNNQIFSVNPLEIQEKPIASSASGFDELSRITIPYPNIDTNSTIFLKIEQKSLSPVLQNQHLEFFSFDHSSYTKSYIIHIISELPLYVEKRDPNQLIKVSQTTKKENDKILYLVDIIQKKPFIQGIINEKRPILNPKHISYVSISSMKSWSEFGKHIAIEYEKIKKEPLPVLYQEIADIAKTKPTYIEKINTITSMLSEKITYLIVDMKTIQGKAIPKHLESVAKSHLGDCKDFSMATSVILNSIGIPSKLALVKRGETQLALPLTSPNGAFFNHVIVKVELPNKTLWVDPTNFHSMLSPVFPDIANKPALVLDVNNPHLEQIPGIEPEQNVFNVQETWSMKNPEALKIKGNLQLSGIYAANFTGLQKKIADESIRFALIDQLNDCYGQILEKEVVLPNLKSTIVENLSFDYNIQSRNFGLQTNAGTAMPILFNHIQKFQTEKGSVSDLYLGAPGIIDITSTIEDIKPSDQQLLNCNIKSPWADLTRTVEYESNKIVVHQTMKLKKSWIEGPELQSKTYKKFQLALNRYFNNGIGIVFEPLN